MEILQLLKEKTKTYHNAIEQNPYAVALFAQKFDNSALIPYLIKFWGFHEPMEEVLGVFPEWEVYNFDFARRRKLALLQEDLLALGLSEAEIAVLPRCTSLPEIHTFPQALGAMYVLEGSTLGGRIISQQMQKVGEKKSAYFNSYGELTASMWKEFCQLLTAYSPSYEQEILSSAIQTYEKLNVWMNS